MASPSLQGLGLGLGLGVPTTPSATHARARTSTKPRCASKGPSSRCTASTRGKTAATANSTTTGGIATTIIPSPTAKLTRHSAPLPPRRVYLAGGFAWGVFACARGAGALRHPLPFFQASLCRCHCIGQSGLSWLGHRCPIVATHGGKPRKQSNAMQQCPAGRVTVTPAAACNAKKGFPPLPTHTFPKMPSPLPGRARPGLRGSPAWARRGIKSWQHGRPGRSPRMHAPAHAGARPRQFNSRTDPGACQGDNRN